MTAPSSRRSSHKRVSKFDHSKLRRGVPDVKQHDRANQDGGLPPVYVKRVADAPIKESLSGDLHEALLYHLAEPASREAVSMLDPAIIVDSDVLEIHAWQQEFIRQYDAVPSWEVLSNEFDLPDKWSDLNEGDPMPIEYVIDGLSFARRRNDYRHDLRTIVEEQKDLPADEATAVAIRRLQERRKEWYAEDRAPAPTDGVRQHLDRLRDSAEAKRLYSLETADVRFTLPPVGRTLADDLLDPPERVTYTVAELHPRETNTLIIASYKTGKSTLAINLAKSLVDGVAFLDRFPTAFPRGRVALLNYEMSQSMFHQWLLDADIENPDRVVKLDLRGHSMPFNDPGVIDRLVDWLKGNDVKFLMIDPLAKANVGVVDNESDNMQARNFTDTLDALKERAGVPDLVLMHHMGRGINGEGSETSRGATRYQDWCDAFWVLRKTDDGPRTLWAQGRDVDRPAEEAVVLDYDSSTRWMYDSGLTRGTSQPTAPRWQP